ncbi:hypothetical protein A7E77_00050 [Sphingomonas sp. NIC1]|nr:hypothetical protein A7E77_00050 [Sphingomonas sp. NIC1]
MTMKTIKLSGLSDKSVLVDEDQYEALSCYRWYGLNVKGSLTTYARTTIGRRHVYMHRLIMGMPKMGVVDHIDGNGLNNQRENLRLVTQKVNCQQARARQAYDAWKAGESQESGNRL